MPAAIRRLALVMLMAILPAQVLAAIVMPLCHQELAASVLDASAHSHSDGHDHDHGATTPGHDHPLTAGEFGSDHCSSASAFAIPAMATTLQTASASERCLFKAAQHVSGYIPEQPQRPPLA